MPDKYKNFVEHPRYGREPRITGLDPRDDGFGTKFFHWHSPPECRVPNTAITADPTKQREATIAVTHYFDVSRRCRDCKRMFLFFAEEQRYWYEVLGFGLESDCIRFVDCRRSERQIAEQRRTYDGLLGKTERTDDENLELIDCGLSLMEQSIFGTRCLQSMRALLNSLSHPKLRASEVFQRLQARADRLLEMDPPDQPKRSS